MQNFTNFHHYKLVVRLITWLASFDMYAKDRLNFLYISWANDFISWLDGLQARLMVYKLGNSLQAGQMVYKKN